VVKVVPQVAFEGLTKQVEPGTKAAVPLVARPLAPVIVVNVPVPFTATASVPGEAVGITADATAAMV
jgi:hypothetical protein